MSESRLSAPWLGRLFYAIAQVVAGGSTCLRRRVGAIVVKERVLTTGYNGVPAGITHCLEVGASGSV